MADNKFEIVIVVKDGNGVKLAEKNIRQLGTTVERTGRQHKQAAKDSRDLYDTQAKGVIGTANSTKSFSKLTETIGRNGSSGLVGAYATLAANIFAVSAAFMALRSAAQVEQIFKGLEAAGVRTGRSLNNLSKELREVTGNAINTEQAMRGVAQITSAGFGADSVRRLGQAARDTSFALGRSMTDALERITRGVVKLEPELLDELGIMTKLTESNALYAQKLNKTETQLTNFEKRQGFLNAVLAEAELKFGGLSAAAGNSTNYDKLAATFTDLSNTILNAINVIAAPIAGFLSSSTTSLAALGLLFAGTIRNQLVPGFLDSAKAAARSAEALKLEAEEKKENLKTTRDQVIAQKQAVITGLANADYVGNKAPKAYKNLSAAIKEGKVEARDYTAALTSLQRSVRANEQLMNNNPSFGANTERGKLKQEEIDNARRQMTAITQLQLARSRAANEDIEYNERVSSARMDAARASAAASRDFAAATALDSAANREYGATLTSIKEAVAQQRQALQLTSDATIAQAGVLKQALAPALITAQTRMYAFTLSVRAAGVALLNAIPIIGQILFAIGLLTAAWDFMKSDATKKFEAAWESFNETAGNAVKIGDELLRVTLSQVPASGRAAAALTIQSNAVRETAERYNELLSASDKVNQNGAFRSLFESLTGQDDKDKVANFSETLGKQAAISYALGIRKGSQVMNLADDQYNFFRGFFGTGFNSEAEAALKTLNSLNEAAPKELEAWVKRNYGSWELLRKAIDGNNKALKEVSRTAANDLAKAIGGGADQVKNLQEAFKQLETDLSSFYRSAAISTPFDAILKSTIAVNDATMALSKTYGEAGEWQKILTGIDSNTSSTLSVEAQNQLKTYREADATVQSLLQKEKERAAVMREHRQTGDALSAQDRYRLENAQAVVSQGKTVTTLIMQELEARERLYIKAQEITRQNAAQLSLLQAQNQAVSDIYKAGAAGMRARLADEDRVRNIQKAQLQIQIDVLKTSQSLNESKINDLTTSIEKNKQLMKEWELTQNITLEQRKQALASKGISALLISQMQEKGFDSRNVRGNVSQETKDELDAYLFLSRKVKEANDTRQVQEEQLRSAQNASRDILASIRQLTTQIAAIDAQRLDAAEKRAALQRAELEFRKQNLSELQSQASTADDLNTIYREIDNIVAGTTDNFRNQLSIISKTATDERRRRTFAQEERIRDLKVAETEALALQNKTGLTKEQKAAADALVTSAKEALSIAEQGYALDMRKIDAQEQQAILAKVYFDTMKEGLEWQRSSLDMMTKQLDAQRALREETTRVEELRTRLAYKRAGLEVSENTEKSFEIQAAADAYKFAVQESEIKKSLIDLEYALLEAQRDQLREELIQRRDMIAQMDPTNTKRIDQLDSSIARIENVDFGAATEAAKRTIDRQVEAARILLDTALTREPTGINKTLSNFLGFFDRRKAEERARHTREDARPITPGRTVAPETEAEKAARAARDNPLISSNNELIKKISAWIAAVEKAIGVTTSALDTATASGSTSLRQAFDYANRNGFRADELKGVTKVGKHTKGSKHYSGQAFDVNIGYGNVEADNPEMARRMDQLAAYYGSQGFKVLWRTKDHFDHMHVEMTDAVGKAMKATEVSVVKTATATSAVIEQAAETVEKASGADATITGTRSKSDSSLVQTTPRTEGADPIRTNGLGTALDFFTDISSDIVENLGKLGPEGEIVLSVVNGLKTIIETGMSALELIRASNAELAEKIENGTATAQDRMENFATKFSAVASVVQSALSMIQSATAASAQAKEEAIQREITAEQRRDGKSAESVAKIQALEKKKDEIARKQFNTNKKLQMAQAIISTAAGVAQALAYGPIVGPILAGVIAAMGAAQIAIIAGTQYQSSASSASNVPEIPSLSIGKRGDSVDLARQNTNVGGELGYLRGTPGVGTTASNYRVIGSAYGGDLPRGYGSAGFVVGEKGPETIMPETPLTVRPANDNEGRGSPIDATINIRALDAQGVEDILRDQRGNIISMLREAANDSGSRFLEDVDVNVYTRPNVGRL